MRRETLARLVEDYGDLCHRILKLDRRVRAAAVVDISGDKLDIKIREDVVDKKLAPLGSMPRWGHVLGVAPWTAAENLERYFGHAEDVTFRFEKIDFCLLRMRGDPSPLADKVLILTLEKGMDIPRLLTQVKALAGV
ncbi:MAG: hypothetical protein ACE5PO_03960 [Candidatus Bathyarchaeia archaeon]